MNLRVLNVDNIPDDTGDTFEMDGISFDKTVVPVEMAERYVGRARLTKVTGGIDAEIKLFDPLNPVFGLCFPSCVGQILERDDKVIKKCVLKSIMISNLPNTDKRIQTVSAQLKTPARSDLFPPGSTVEETPTSVRVNIPAVELAPAEPPSLQEALKTAAEVLTIPVVGPILAAQALADAAASVTPEPEVPPPAEQIIEAATPSPEEIPSIANSEPATTAIASSVEPAPTPEAAPTQSVADTTAKDPEPAQVTSEQSAPSAPAEAPAAQGPAIPSPE